MQVYFKAYGIRGIRTVLKQFNEETLTQWQRDLLKQRLEILQWYDEHERNQSVTARRFDTSRPHIAQLVKIRKNEGLGGLIPKPPGPKYKRGDTLSHEQRREIERYATAVQDTGKNLRRVVDGRLNEKNYQKISGLKNLVI